MRLLFRPRMRDRPVVLPPQKMELGLAAAWPLYIIRLIRYLWRALFASVIGVLSVGTLLWFILHYQLGYSHVKTEIILLILAVILKITGVKIPFYDGITLPRLRRGKMIGGRKKRKRKR